MADAFGNPDHIDLQITAMREAGASLRLISKATGLSESGVGHRVKRLGLPLQPTNPRKVDVDAEVERRRRDGETLDSIAQFLGVDPKSVSRRAARLGVTNPHATAEQPRRRQASQKAAIWAEELSGGMNVAQIAAKHGVTYKAVDSALRRRLERSRTE